jgi:hypothetical protein
MMPAAGRLMEGSSFYPVYPDGNVCISILHTPGEDPLMYEQASERWSPVQSVEKVLLSVISMLAGMCVCVFLIAFSFSFIVPKRDSAHAPFYYLANTPARTEPREWREH